MVGYMCYNDLSLIDMCYVYFLYAFNERNEITIKIWDFKLCFYMLMNIMVGYMCMEQKAHNWNLCVMSDT